MRSNKPAIVACALSVSLALGAIPAFAQTQANDPVLPSDAVAQESPLESQEASAQEQTVSETESFKGLEADSFRFHDGRPVGTGLGAAGDEDEELEGEELIAQADAWRKDASGNYLSSDGSVIRGAIRRGVDVSEWQGDINWAKVRNDDVSFAIIRCGGTFYESRKQYDDSTYERNAAELERLGIPYGVYFFSTAFTVEEAIKEADFTIAKLKGKNVTLPVYLDLEYEEAASRLSQSEWAAIAKAYCDRIEAAGYTPGVYASLSWWNNHLTDPVFNQWTRWVAQYYSRCQYEGAYDIWQCSSSVYVDGITTGTVDLNFDLGIEDSLSKEDLASDVWERVWGQDAVGTMAEVAKKGWDTSDAVVVATKDGYWDALSASSVAGYLGVPVVITSTGSLDEAAAETVRSLGATTAYLVGGEKALAPQVESDLRDAGVETIERIWGEDAPATAREVETWLEGERSTCFVATSNGYWDALSASPISYARNFPIFLTKSSTQLLEDETVEAIADGGYEHVIIVGGTLAVPEEVVEQLTDAGVPASSITRSWGETAIETSTAVAEYGLSVGMSAQRMGVATGNGYWDALTGAALCGSNDAVMVLVLPTNRSSIYDFVQKHEDNIGTGYVFGGELAVSHGSFNALVRVTG